MRDLSFLIPSLILTASTGKVCLTPFKMKRYHILLRIYFYQRAYAVLGMLSTCLSLPLVYKQAKSKDCLSMAIVLKSYVLAHSRSSISIF